MKEQVRRCTLARRGRKLQLAVVVFGEALHDGKSQPSALATESTGQMNLIHTGAVVGDADAYAALLGPTAQQDLSSVRHRLNAVVDQVNQHLAHLLLVSKDDNARVNVGEEFDTLILGDLAVEQFHFLAKRIEMHSGLLALALARDVDKVAYQQVNAVDFLDHLVAEQMVTLALKLAVDDLQTRSDAGKGVARLVRNIGSELAGVGQLFISTELFFHVALVSHVVHGAERA